MGQRGNVDNLGYFDACTVDGADCRLTTVAGTLYISLYLAEAQVIRQPLRNPVLPSGLHREYSFEPRKPILPALDHEIT